jgi:hypothetical protein
MIQAESFNIVSVARIVMKTNGRKKEKWRPVVSGAGGTNIDL